MPVPSGGRSEDSHTEPGGRRGIMPILLLIDDAPVFLELERSFVRRPEFELVGAENITALLSRAGERRPDLVIAPAAVADEKGCDLRARLKALPGTRGVPVLLYGTPAERAHAKVSPPDVFLVSPWGHAELLTTIRSFCQVTERGSERAPASVRVLCGDGRESYVAFTKDISTTGIFLKGASTVQPGDSLRLRLTLPCEPQPLAYDLLGEVVRLVAHERDSHLVPGIGIRFLDLPLESKMPLARYVREHATS